ncbi:hypothetical protein KK2020170_05060 [Flavobacterium okayamense]|uniref:Uncharacterized protein n=1 Tax=Flavobacterium okayamense TaxID=2830782 RepID=A0ABN6HZG9_9FLAO|nr:hypothetical protein KK2020170_05060 [Flavobacterium okayamense]
MDILDKIFISLAKIYALFYKEHQGQWFFLPLFMIGTIITLNIMCLSFFFTTFPFYYFIIFYIAVNFLLYLKLEKITYYAVKEFEQSLRIRFLIYFSIIINIVIIIFFVNYTKTITLHY